MLFVEKRSVKNSRAAARGPRTLILPVLSLVRSARSVFTPLKGGWTEHWRSFGCSFWTARKPSETLTCSFGPRAVNSGLNKLVQNGTSLSWTSSLKLLWCPIKTSKQTMVTANQQIVDAVNNLKNIQKLRGTGHRSKGLSLGGLFFVTRYCI